MSLLSGDQSFKMLFSVANASQKVIDFRTSIKLRIALVMPKFTDDMEEVAKYMVDVADEVTLTGSCSEVVPNCLYLVVADIRGETTKELIAKRIDEILAQLNKALES